MVVVIREQSESIQANHGVNCSEFMYDGQRIRIQCRFLEQGRTLSDKTRSFHHPGPSFFRLFLFEKGTASLQTNGTEHQLVGGVLYGLPDNMEFEVTYNPCNLVYFHLQLVDHTGLPVCEGMNKVLSLRLPYLFDAVLDAFALGQQARLQALVQEVVVSMTDSQYPALVHRMLRTRRFGRVMDAVSRTPPALLNIDELARLSNSTRAALSKGFKRAMGISLKEYMTQIYIQRAKELLGFSDKTIDEIALLLGHDTPPYFYRKFKKITGKTPNVFRMIQQEKPGR